MVIYECPRCHYETSHKNTLRRHYNRKRVCKTLFSRKSIKDCKYELDNPKEKVMIDKDELEKLQEENRRLKECKTLNITNNIDNSVTDNSKNITINSYKDTDIENIKDDMRNMKVLKDDLDTVLKYIKLVHFSDKRPENHNMYMENANLRRLMQLEEGEFKEKGRGNVGIDNFINQDVGKQLSRFALGDTPIYNAWEGLWNVFNEPKEKESQEDRDEKKKIRDKVFSLMNGNRNKIKKTARDNGIQV